MIRPADQWLVCLPDRYPAHIDRPTFDANPAAIRDNFQEHRGRMSRGVARSGAALLQGTAYCARCGHKLTVAYQSQPRYVCNVHKRSHQEGRECQRVPIAAADEAVSAAFWEALAPAEFDRYDAALAGYAQDQRRFDQAWRRQVERLRYDARLAEKQYRLVDPENRLVAAELERRWNHALEAVQRAEADSADRRLAPEPIDDRLRRQVADARHTLAALWAAGAVSNDRRKAIVRTLIDKVVLHRPRPDRLHVRIVWAGGARTQVERPLPVLTYAELSDGAALTAELLRRARCGEKDAAIARALTAAGYHVPRGDRLSKGAVAEIRRRHGVDAPQTRLRRDGCPGWLTITQVAARIAEPASWMLHGIRRGRIRVAKDRYYGVFLFPDDGRVPDGLKQVLRSRRVSITIEPRVSR